MTKSHAAWKETLWDIVCYVAGGAVYALSVNCFSAPNDIAPGGATGLATLLHALIGWPIGLLILLINLPLLIVAFFRIGRRFALRTTAVTLLVSLIIDVSEPFLPTFRGERILAALFGGLLAGVGLGLVLLRGATTGGSELAARLLQERFPYLSIGRLILAVDAVVIALSVPVFGGLSAAMYAAILVFVSSVMTDKLVYGGEEGRLLMVVTLRPQALSEAVTARLKRGVTLLRGQGGYTGRERWVLLCAVRRAQLVPLRRLVRETDPDAFTMVITTRQVFGEGFLPAEDP